MLYASHSFPAPFFISMSPLWPLGDNPRIGDPYIIVNKQTNKLAYINQGKIQGVFPVATGKKTNDLTPEGEFDVVRKAKKNPYYIKRTFLAVLPRTHLDRAGLVFNARGTDGSKYGIHGTNAPSSIGKYISQGCIRMYNKDVEYLYDRIPMGTKVLIVKNKNHLNSLPGAIARSEQPAP
ncbi:L,D-transpeptidase [Ectobacillus funiculus]